MNPTRLLITRPLPEPVLEQARTQFDLKLWHRDEPIGKALVPWAADRQALLVMATDPLDRPTLQALAPSVKAIATYSVGHDHIDLDAATELGLPVFNTPDVLSDAVAEVAMLLILSAARDAGAAEAVLRAGQWGPWSPTRFLGVQLTGRRLGIFGMGRIGQEVAWRAKGFGLDIHYHNRKPVPDACCDAQYHDTLESLLRVSQVFCVCAPATEQTRNIIDRDRLALLPAGAIFVNVSRGDLVDEDALIAAIRSGHIGAAGLDVYRNEPRIDPRLLQLPRTTLLPHIGSATEEARIGMGQLALDALHAWLHQGGRPSNWLNPGVGVFRG